MGVANDNYNFHWGKSRRCDFVDSELSEDDYGMALDGDTNWLRSQLRVGQEFGDSLN